MIVFGKWERGFRTIRNLQYPDSDLILESKWWIIISVENLMICIAKITMLHSHFAKSIKIHSQFLPRLTTGRPLEAVQVPIFKHAWARGYFKMNGFNLEKAVSKLTVVSIQKMTSKVLMMLKRFVKIFHPWLGLLENNEYFHLIKIRVFWIWET